jgi:hypothetical protein
MIAMYGAGSASANTIDVSNLGFTPTGKTVYSPVVNSYMSTQFRTGNFVGPSDPILSLTLRLQNESGGSVTNALAYIYTSTANNLVSSRRPNTLVPNAVFQAPTISATNPNGSGSLTYQDVVFSAAAGSVSLAANTNYWVVFFSSPDMAINWLNYSTNSVVNGTNALIQPFAATSITGAVGSWTGQSFIPNQFEITTVPEPTTYALAAISAGVLGLYGRRRKAAKA